MTTDTMLAQYAGKSLTTTVNRADTPHPITLNFVIFCRRSFVSDDKLIDHMTNIHPGATVHSREEMIEDKRAREHAAKQLYKDFQKKHRKKKKKKKYWDDDDVNDKDGDETYHSLKTTMMTARLTLSSGPLERSSGKLMRRVTHK